MKLLLKAILCHSQKDTCGEKHKNLTVLEAIDIM
jgi:hypothetical protein